MSIVSLQIGQCGNQVGGEFFRTVMSDIRSVPYSKSRLETEYSETSSETFFNRRDKGNNWAFGFLVHGPTCEPAVAECLRQELENCDCVDGILMTMSLAGGTGSGVGTYLSR
ncbi:unnamed protein product [Dibothriocephalus latus]|uniref:Tubulin/FtsZ GTPase domain-containing protein n=1 Tax=Dibothriocephalus latus TaxID=60516 RepID=A0A3P7NUU8_DIBLA|nr:unnamed protein product [Dibothriocephalus latus]